MIDVANKEEALREEPSEHDGTAIEVALNPVVQMNFLKTSHTDKPCPPDPIAPVTHQQWNEAEQGYCVVEAALQARPEDHFECNICSFSVPGYRLGLLCKIARTIVLSVFLHKNDDTAKIFASVLKKMITLQCF